MGLFSRSAKSKQTNIFKGLDRQSICHGCKQVEVLLERSLSSNAAVSGRLPFHKDFAELDQCASQCLTCRIFRQALLLRCVTAHEAAQLPRQTTNCPVYARIELPRQPQDSAQAIIHLEIKDHPNQSAQTYCSSGSSSSRLNLAEDPRSSSDRIATQVRSWLEECSGQHKASCANLRWSNQAPTRLVRILSDSRLQLSSSHASSVDYAAVSYSWGTQILTPDDRPVISKGQTTPLNIRPRHDSLSISDLPSTLQDAVTLCRLVGLSYVWIDSLCIIQEEKGMSDFLHEAPRMNEYYGNARFTIAVCCNDKATLPMLAPRPAFVYPIQDCRLSLLYLNVRDIPLKDMLSQSPLSKRAWTLQEEHLSPRILFWASNRLYWSCSRMQRLEGSGPSPDQPSLQRATADEKQTTAIITDDSPQSFLLACNRGSQSALLNAWQSIIERYLVRDMTKLSDRFSALAGLAARYKEAWGQENKYLAGVWEASLATNLSWAVSGSPPASPPPVSLEQGHGPPSWTWASLPTRTSIRTMRTKSSFTGRSAFSLLGASVPGHLQEHASKSSSPIVAGSLVSQIRVRATIWPFWADDAVYRPWPQVAGTVPNPSSTGNDIHDGLAYEFFFGDNPSQSAYSVDATSGVVVSYRARRREIVGKLDYQSYAQRIINEPLALYALEVTQETLLLLEQVGDGAYRRMGIVWESGNLDYQHWPDQDVALM